MLILFIKAFDICQKEKGSQHITSGECIPLIIIKSLSVNSQVAVNLCAIIRNRRH